jgi:Spy/CpxP family protein refolding chaperone
MKLRVVLVSVGLAGFATAFLYAQGPGPGQRQGGPKQFKQFKQAPGGLEGVLSGPNAERRLTRLLNLDAAQQNQVHTALEERQVMLKGLPEKAREFRTQLTEAIRAGDEGKIDQVTRDLAQLNQQQMAIVAKTTAKIYSVLNAEQKALFDRALNRDLGLRGKQLRRGAGQGAVPQSRRL